MSISNSSVEFTCLADQNSCWQLLLQWHPDDRESMFPFSARLATEQGWTRTFALRAIEEYRRFVFLSVAAGHVICPSEQVDQVWHQHLTFTESYWDDLCGRILQRPLHHRPTKGGAAEQIRHWNLYEQTRNSYRIWFGESPPVDLWPEPEQRFRNEQTERVSRRDYWVLPKPRHWLQSNELITRGFADWQHFQSRPQLRSVGLCGCLIAAVPAAAVWNPLDWQGPDFLQFYLLSLIAVAIFGIFFRLLFRPQESSVPNDLNHEEIACLNGNWRLAVNSALARLIAAGSITAVETRSVPRFSCAGNLPSDLSQLAGCGVVFLRGNRQSGGRFGRGGGQLSQGMGRPIFWQRSFVAA